MLPSYPVNPNGSQPASLGQPTPASEMEQWIVEAVNAKTAQQVDFTAYDITLQVRQDHPGRNVPHQDVRLYVHTWMAALMAAGTYSCDLRSLPGGAQAYVYFPVHP